VELPDTVKLLDRLTKGTGEHMYKLVVAGLTVVALVAAPGEAQHPMDEVAAHQPNLFEDLDQDLAVVKNKLVGLAEAMPPESFDWRPGDGVRSVSETLLHVAADNYFIPMALGETPPEKTGIIDYPSTQAFEKQDLSKDEVVETLEESFGYLQRLLADSDAMSVGDEVNLFGRESTVQKTWILTVTHLHEHLGQMISYARMNDVTPPWSM